MLEAIGYARLAEHRLQHEDFRRMLRQLLSDSRSMTLDQIADRASPSLPRRAGAERNLAGSAVGQQIWLLATTSVAMAIVNATLYAHFAGAAQDMLAARRARRRFNLAGGALLAGAGVWALLARRPRAKRPRRAGPAAYLKRTPTVGLPGKPA